MGLYDNRCKETHRDNAEDYKFKRRKKIINQVVSVIMRGRDYEEYGD